jgi:phenylpropionate dioxygenase-like ring-hydroxylating dioxygenase large terminal subunit
MAPLEPSLSRAAYVDDAFFAHEQEAIFRREWFVVGRTEQFATPGAYRTIEVAGESIIVVRGPERLAAFLNFCRHRGSRLLCGEGVARDAIRCPYHGWTYGLDGTLRGTPFVERADVPPEIDGLHRAGIAEWGGFVFVRVAGPAASATLEAQLGPVVARTARYGLADLRTARTLTYDVAANWKVLLENYNECYHCGPVHPELCRLVPAFRAGGGSALDWERGIPHREGAYTFTTTGTTSRAALPALDNDERTRHKGELIYPNLLLSLCADHVAAFTIFPHGPAKTRVVCEFLFHPDEMERADFDPSDAVDFWDIVNGQDWRICEGVQAGMRSHAFRFGYYAPMEDASLDIRRYIAARMGDDAAAPGGDG